MPVPVISQLDLFKVLVLLHHVVIRVSTVEVRVGLHALHPFRVGEACQQDLEVVGALEQLPWYARTREVLLPLLVAGKPPKWVQLI